MKITRRDIANYRLLGILLDKDRRKLQKYVEKRPSCYSGKVYGSNPQFPYEPKGFTIDGCSEHEQVKMKEWEENCRIMEEQIKTDMEYLHKLEMEIDKVIADCKDIEDKAILEFTKDGMSQQEILTISQIRLQSLSLDMYGGNRLHTSSVTLNNIYDDFTDYDFEGAEIAIYVGLAISPTGMVFPEEKKWLDISENPILDTNGNEILLLYSDAVTEKIRLCTMTVVEAPYQNSSIITLTCQDNMMKFDRDYSESKLKYPATRSEIIRDACNVCGVQLQTVTFDNDDYVIETRPDDQQLTFRQVLAWVAQIGGQFCRCDSYGRLCIAWYDLKSYESSHIDEDKFVSVESYDSLSINNEDVVITGIKVTEYKENVSTDESPVSYQYGEDGYVIEIKDNKLIAEGKGNDIATIIGKRIVGMRFRPFSASMMNNPLAEAGDICIITDRKGNQYKSLVTSTIFQVGNKQTIECGAKSAARNSAKQYSLASQAIVENRKNLQKERSDREKALEELSKRISQSSGLYTTVEESQGGGKVYYLHNKALLSDSDIVWKMTAEAWGVSTDGGNTWNGGMTVDGDTVVRILDAVGVRANWINTGEFKVADEKGNEVFYVNCDTGVVRIKAQSFLLSGTSIEEISKRQLDAFVEGTYKSDMSGINGKIDTKNANYYQSSDPSLSWTTITEEALADIDGNPILDVDGNEILIRVESEKIAHEDDVWKNTSDNVEYIYKSGNWVRVMLPNDIMEQLDGKIDSYFKDYEPELNNYPANEWTTDNERASHNGDLFYWKSTGMCYRFVQILYDDTLQGIVDGFHLHHQNHSQWKESTYPISRTSLSRHHCISA